jgi:hypothetical protein
MAILADDGSIAKVLKLQGHGKIVPAHRADHGLQIVAVLAGDSDFVSLNLRGDFQLQVADERRDFLGLTRVRFLV